MKIKTTAKAIKANYNNIISVGYCNIQTLLYCNNPTAYTCGVYGWNADIYTFDGSTAIVTGYRPFGNYSASYDICEKYEKKAQEILANTRDYTTRKEQLQIALAQFITEVLSK